MTIKIKCIICDTVRNEEQINCPKCGHKWYKKNGGDVNG